jgi:hypothetical protein
MVSIVKTIKRGEIKMARTGPAPKGEYVDKAKTLSTRITGELRSALDAAKEKSGRSLSQEIEYRLRRSFEEDTKMKDIFGGRENYAIARLIGCLLDSHGSDWKRDEENFDYIIASVALVLRLFGPRSTRPHIVELNSEGMPDRTQMAAFITGRVIAAEVADATDGLPTAAGDPYPHIKADLPRDAVERLNELADAQPEFVRKKRKEDAQ